MNANKTFAYIIADGEVVATTSTALKNGAEIRFAFAFCEEHIDASRDYNLVNARYGKISRAKKWDSVLYKHPPRAKELEEGEFWIQE